MGKRLSPLEQDIVEILSIAKALSREGERTGQYHYKIFVMESLAVIKLCLNRILLVLSSLLGGLLGLVISKFLFG